MNEGTLVLKRTFDAAPAVVWKAWTDPKQIAEWYGPEGFKNTIHSMDVREGGAYRLTMHAPNGEEHKLRGTFKTLDAPKKLIMTWQWENEGMSGGENAETVVTVEFKEAGGKTEMTLTHVLPHKKSRDMHEQGWSSSFNKLEQVLA